MKLTEKFVQFISTFFMMFLGIVIIRTEKCWPNSPTHSTDVGVLRGWGRAQITVDILGREAKKVEKHWPRPIGPRKFPFKPTTSAWRQYHRKRLQIVSERMPCTVRRQIKSELKEPTKIRKIDGDGNCLFRALSAEITNSQDHHTLIKNALVTFMTSEDTSHIFSNYCGQDTQV